MQVRSYAKINWALRITGKRPDGYHDLETLFQTISLHDTLAFRRADAFSFDCDVPWLPRDESNLVVRAVRKLGTPPVSIALTKRIPSGGGLGGGSSNAAATLVALNEMFAMGRNRNELASIALELGSDVPFFLVGGTAFATGRGEMLTPMPAAAPIPLLLVFPKERVSTAQAFSQIRRYSAPLGIDRYRAILADDLLAHGDELVNDFEPSVFAQLPHLAEIKDALRGAGGAWSAMTGSGSTVVGAFRSQAQRDAALEELRGRWNARVQAAESVQALGVTITAEAQRSHRGATE